MISCSAGNRLRDKAQMALCGTQCGPHNFLTKEIRHSEATVTSLIDCHLAAAMEEDEVELEAGAVDAKIVDVFLHSLPPSQPVSMRGWPFLLSLASAGLHLACWKSDDWVRAHAQPPLCEHDVSCILGLRSVDVLAILRQDPMRPWEKAPPSLSMQKIPWAQLQEPRIVAAEAFMHVSSASLIASCVAVSLLAAGSCRNTRIPKFATLLLLADALLCFVATIALSSWCATRLRPSVARILYGLTNGEAAIQPHRLEIWPGPGSLSFVLAGICSFLAALILLGLDSLDEKELQGSGLAKIRSTKSPKHKDRLVRLVAQSRKELVRSQQQWADRLLIGCASCFAFLLLSSLWVVGQKAVDLGVKDALNKPTWRQRRHGVPWRQDYREAWRDVKAASICTGIRTAIKIDDFRKSVQEKADLTAQQVKGGYESFVERVLKADHERCLEEIREATAILEECKTLRRNISLLLKDDISELETSVELGCQFYVKAFVPDTSSIFIDVGLNFRLEMPLTEAQAFLEDKELHLMKGLELKNKRVARVKADIHEALHLIDLMTQVQSEALAARSRVQLQTASVWHSSCEVAMSLLASETHAKVAAVQNSLQVVEKHLGPLLSKTSKEVGRHLEALENAELQVSLAYAAASLYFCHLLSQGVDPSDHPIRQELDRIQLYFKKVRTAVEGAAEKEVSRERARVDVEAAKRIVQHFAHAAEASAQRRNDAPRSAEVTGGLQAAEPQKPVEAPPAEKPVEVRPAVKAKKKIKKTLKPKPKEGQKDKPKTGPKVASDQKSKAH
eukprot:s411_g5.t1